MLLNVARQLGKSLSSQVCSVIRLCNTTTYCGFILRSICFVVTVLMFRLVSKSVRTLRCSLTLQCMCFATQTDNEKHSENVMPFITSHGLFKVNELFILFDSAKTAINQMRGNESAMYH